MSEDARRFDELDEEVKSMLRHLSHEEVQTLTYLSTIPKDELSGMMKIYRDFRAVGWFAKWLILATVSVFIGAVALGESIARALAWFRSSS